MVIAAIARRRASFVRGKVCECVMLPAFVRMRPPAAAAPQLSLRGGGLFMCLYAFNCKPTTSNYAPLRIAIANKLAARDGPNRNSGSARIIRYRLGADNHPYQGKTNTRVTSKMHFYLRKRSNQPPRLQRSARARTERTLPNI